MSIDEIKKKSKLSLDEMLDNKAVGNLDGQTPGQVDENLGVKQEVKKVDHKSVQNTSHSTIRKSSHTDEKLICKITFNTSERLLHAFNTIYANRIINNKKTDKSALLNEALELLIEKEKSNQ